MGSFSCALKCKLQPLNCLTRIGTEGSDDRGLLRAARSERFAGRTPRPTALLKSFTGLDGNGKEGGTRAVHEREITTGLPASMQFLSPHPYLNTAPTPLPAVLRRWLASAHLPLRANTSETIEWLKFTLEGAGERTHGYAFTDTTFAGCWI